MYKSLFIFFSFFVFLSQNASAQSVIGSINSGAVSNNDLMFSVGEIFVIPTTNIDDANSGTMGIVYRNQLLKLVGINEVIFSENAKAFPNPVSNVVTIEFEDEIRFHTIKVYDVSGRLITTENVQNNQVDLSNLESGTYILRTEKNVIKPIKIIKK